MSHHSMGVHGGNVYAHGCWHTWDTSAVSAQGAIQMAAPPWEHFSPISSPDPPQQAAGTPEPPSNPPLCSSWGLGGRARGAVLGAQAQLLPPLPAAPPAAPGTECPRCLPDCSSPTGNSSRHQVYFQQGSVSHFRIGKKENRYVCLFFSLKSKYPGWVFLIFFSFFLSPEFLVEIPRRRWTPHGCSALPLAWQQPRGCVH